MGVERGSQAGIPQMGAVCRAADRTGELPHRESRYRAGLCRRVGRQARYLASPDLRLRWNGARGRARMIVRDATDEDVWHVCRNLREADRHEQFATRFDDDPDRLAADVI